MDRICATPTCSARIPVQRGRSRPRKFCEDCRPPRNRPNPRVVSLPIAAESAEPPLVTSYRERLRKAGRLDTPEGAHVMLLAQTISAGGNTASGVALLSRELAARMAEALRGTAVKADGLDELARRRAGKAGA